MSSLSHEELLLDFATLLRTVEQLRTRSADERELRKAVKVVDYFEREIKSRGVSEDWRLECRSRTASVMHDQAVEDLPAEEINVWHDYLIGSWPGRVR